MAVIVITDVIVTVVIAVIIITVVIVAIAVIVFFYIGRIYYRKFSKTVSHSCTIFTTCHSQ